MKTQSRRFVTVVFVAASMGLWGGCTVTQKAYLQEMDVRGTQHLPPVRVAKDQKPGEFRATFGVGHAIYDNLGVQIPGHSKVNAKGVFQTDTVTLQNGGNTYHVLRETPNANVYPFTGENLHWKPTPNLFWIDVQLMAGEVVALHGGLTFGSSGGTSLSDWRVGIGFLGKGTDIGYRLDLGVQTGELLYQAETAVTTTVSTPFGTSEPSTVFYSDNGKNVFLDMYASFTLNTCLPNSAVQYYLNGAMMHQTMFDYPPNTIDPYFAAMFLTTVVDNNPTTKYSTTTFVVTPGLFFDLAEKLRLTVGARYVAVGGFDEVTFKGYWVPFGQFEFGF